MLYKPSILEIALAILVSVSLMNMYGQYNTNKIVDHIDKIWTDSNQVSMANQIEQNKINRAYSNQLEKLNNYVFDLGENEQLHWKSKYNEDVQKLLKTPPSGLRTQDGISK